MILSLIPWMITGVSGFFLFGEKTSANVLDNFPINDIPAIVARFALSLNVAISVPYYCCTHQARNSHPYHIPSHTVVCRPSTLSSQHALTRLTRAHRLSQSCRASVRTRCCLW